MANISEQGSKRGSLARQMGLLGLIATGVCSMVGAAINVIPLMIQRNVPGIGPDVLLAYALAAIPALLAALVYAILASGMPCAGGSYVYASRSLNPYLGFIASFSQWFGLSIAIGVVSYLLIPFIRDVASTLGARGLAELLEWGPVRVLLALAFVWFFVWINIRGIQLYEKTLVPLMFLMLIGGAVVIPWGFYFSHADFEAVVQVSEGASSAGGGAGWTAILAATAILFSTFIGFDSIAQAGGEARNPGRTLPLAIGISIVGVGLYYLLFTAAIYHTVPWQYVAQRAQETDLTAPGLLGHLLSPGWTVLILAGAAIALINDLPAMLLGVSRLMFAWADDEIFPRVVATIHPVRQTPHLAIALSGGMASLSILGSHWAGDFFLGVDILITSMLINFLLMSGSLLALPRRNPALASRIQFVKNGTLRNAIGGVALVTLAALLVTHVIKDLSADVPAWYFRSTYLWLIVVAVASILFSREWRKLTSSGVDWRKRFANLPESSPTS